jgi:Ino eighty subunit 2
MSSRRSQRSTRAAEPVADVILVRPTRSRRTVSENSATATVSRGPATNRSPQSMRLTVKASSSKLREATRSASGKVSVGRDAFVGGEILEGKRERKVRKSYVLESESEPEASEEVEEEDEEMDDVGDEDAEGEEDDEEMEDDGLGDEDADGDIDMDEPPPPPVIRISKAQSGKQTIVAKPAKSAKADSKTVEQKEVELGSDDEELSELDSDLGDDVEEEEAMQTGNEEDAEGEEEEIEVEEDPEEDDELDSDDETPGGGSRASTPDLNKLTKRQRARLEEGGSGHLLALPDGKLSF